MMNKLLCAIGIHKWFNGVKFDKDKNISYAQICIYCEKLKGDNKK